MEPYHKINFNSYSIQLAKRQISKIIGVDWEASGCRSFIISHLHVILGILVFLEIPTV